MTGYTELFINQGADYSIFINITDDYYNLPMNVSNCTFQSQIRTSPYTSNSEASFVVTSIDSSNGNVRASMSSSVTSNIDPGSYYFDIFMTDLANNTITKIVNGVVVIIPRVTR